MNNYMIADYDVIRNFMKTRKEGGGEMETVIKEFVGLLIDGDIIVNRHDLSGAVLDVFDKEVHYRTIKKGEVFSPLRCVAEMEFRLDPFRYVI